MCDHGTKDEKRGDDDQYEREKKRVHGTVHHEKKSLFHLEDVEIVDVSAMCE